MDHRPARRGAAPTGVLDWEYARPPPRLFDVAPALEHVAPFRNDPAYPQWLHYPEPPDWRRRLAVFAVPTADIPP
ncbi:hypothetical protein [Streptomyces carpaticus]|uniref:Uncharacterized protein n=1 Tax=Streptomyces carpaticus TaxID=285558 RepID=A0ABV4ZVE1_9ACTN